MATATKMPTTLQVSNTLVEEWLVENGIAQYDYRPKQAVGQIDKQQSLHNQARFRALDEDRVLLIAEGMEQHPDRVSALVLYQPPRKNKLLTVDGNHRQAAADLIDRKALPAYVITEHLSETQLRLLTFTANVELNLGMPTSMEERLAQALWFIDARGATQEEAAKVMKVPIKKLRVKVQAVRARKRAEALSLPVERLAVGTLNRLDSLQSDEVLKRAAQTINDTRMNTTDASAFVALLNKQRSEKDQLSVIEKERKKREPEAKATVVGKIALPIVVRRMQTLLASVTRIDVLELREAPVDEVIKRQLKARIAEAIKKLAQAQEAL